MNLLDKLFGRYKRPAVVVIVSLLMVSTFLVGYASAWTSTNTWADQSTYIGPGSMASSYQYCIFVDGSDAYCAKNQTSGVVEYRSNNASYVIQSVIDNIDHVSIFMKSGYYYIWWPISITHQNTLTWDEDARWYYTGTDAVLKADAATRGGISQFTLNSPKIWAMSGTGIYIHNSAIFSLNSVIVVAKNGINIDASNTGSVDIEYIGGIHGIGYGIKLGDTAKTNNIKFTNGQITKFDVGIQIGDADHVGGDENSFDMVFVSDCDIGVNITAGTNNAIRDCYFEIQDEYDILARGNVTSIIGGLVVDNSYFLGCPIAIDVDYINGCQVMESESVGGSYVYFRANVTDCTFDTTLWINVHVITGGEVHYIGGNSVAFGTATITPGNDTVVVYHGLFDYAGVIFLTPMQNLDFVTYRVTQTNATAFTIRIDSAKLNDVNFYWIAYMRP